MRPFADVETLELLFFLVGFLLDLRQLSIRIRFEKILPRLWRRLSPLKNMETDSSEHRGISRESDNPDALICSSKAREKGNVRDYSVG